MPAGSSDPGQLARAIFEETLAGLDAGAAVRRAVAVERGRLRVCGDEFDLSARGAGVYCVALGKAAGAMAASVDALLGGRLACGVLSAPRAPHALSPRWRVFEGGHPVPNEASLEAARASLELLRRADAGAALVLFLVSGGGSAMLEWPRDPSITLADLREANRALVNCGAGIAEVNAVRRAFSAVKAGGLSRAAPRAAQITLIVSDTAAGEAHTVASGPTFPHAPERPTPDPLSVIARYDLARQLPAPVLAAVERHAAPAAPRHDAAARQAQTAARVFHVLLDNAAAVERAAEVARARGLSVEVAEDIRDQGVAEGAALLVSRLLELRGRAEGRAVCLISGGEFACPVRGVGVGGRNSETALRCALELEARGLAHGVGATRGPAEGGAHRESPRIVVLSAGTDGLDGNSPAAGALCDETTTARALSLGLDPRRALAASDAYTLFAALGDALLTGPTGTNLRDLRILLAR